MAKLYFYYSAMNAGKTTGLLQSAFNYRERGMDVLLFCPILDDRYGKGKIASRVGLASPAHAFDNKFNFQSFITNALAENPNIKCVLVDESQFLTKEQVWQLCLVVDTCKVPVLTYGLRTDFRGEPFPGSTYLLAWSDKTIEVKTICHCGKKASMNLRLDANGKVAEDGEQILIGGNDTYVSVCRHHFITKEPKGILDLKSGKVFGEESDEGEGDEVVEEKENMAVVV